jgi:hypothetical protein
MAIIEQLREKFFRDEFEFSKHAVDQTVLRKISVMEISYGFRRKKRDAG